LALEEGGMFEGYLTVITRLFNGNLTVIQGLFQDYSGVISGLFRGYLKVSRAAVERDQWLLQMILKGYLVDI